MGSQDVSEDVQAERHCQRKDHGLRQSHRQGDWQDVCPPQGVFCLQDVWTGCQDGFQRPHQGRSTCQDASDCPIQWLTMDHGKDVQGHTPLGQERHLQGHDLVLQGQACACHVKNKSPRLSSFTLLWSFSSTPS